MLKTAFGYIFFFIVAFFLAKPAYAAVELSIADAQSDGSTITIDVSLTGLVSNSCSEGKCYLQAAFRQGSSNHFGYTQDNSGGWYKYESDPGKDNIKSTFFYFEPTDGTWQGTLTAKVDPEASGYTGPGSYEIKVWRYSGNSNGPTGDASNALTVSLTATKPSQESPSPSSGTNNSSSSTSSKSPSPKVTPKASPKKSPSPTPKVLSASTQEASITNQSQQPTIEDSISQVDPNQFSSPNVTPTTQQVSKKFAGILIGSGAVLVVISISGYLYYKRQESGPTIQKEKERFETKEE